MAEVTFTEFRLPSPCRVQQSQGTCNSQVHQVGVWMGDGHPEEDPPPTLLSKAGKATKRRGHSRALSEFGAGFKHSEPLHRPLSYNPSPHLIFRTSVLLEAT